LGTDARGFGTTALGCTAACGTTVLWCGITLLTKCPCAIGAVGVPIGFPVFPALNEGRAAAGENPIVFVGGTAAATALGAAAATAAGFAFGARFGLTWEAPTIGFGTTGAAVLPFKVTGGILPLTFEAGRELICGAAAAAGIAAVLAG